MAGGAAPRAPWGRVPRSILGKMKRAGIGGGVLLGLVGLLAGCMAPPGPSLRERGAPLSSQVGVAVAQIDGDWVVRVAPQGGQVVPGDKMRFGGLRGIGPGRFAVGRGPWAGRQMWVLWMDSGARTALVATPEGDKVLVLDRHAQGGVDRVAAARVVMGWQGFDLAAMDLN